MLRGSDGYDYESLAHRLKGEKADTPRNQAIWDQFATGHNEEEVCVYLKAYDAYPNSGFEKALDAYQDSGFEKDGHFLSIGTRRHIAGRRAVARLYGPAPERKPSGTGRAGKPNPFTSPLAALRAAYQSAISRWLGPF